MQPSEIEALPFYEIEYTIENLTHDLKNTKEAEQAQHDGADTSSYMQQGNKMLSGAKTGNNTSINTPKMPKMPTMKMPKM